MLRCGESKHPEGGWGRSGVQALRSGIEGSGQGQRDLEFRRDVLLV